jgi:hypothetical protein
MTPVEIIEQATVDGVILALFTADTITATGDQSAVDRWLPIIRGNKPRILYELQRECGRAKVLALLEGERFALFVNNDKTDPVIAAVGIRGVATFELSIPRHSYHEMMLILDTIKSKFT